MRFWTILFLATLSFIACTRKPKNLKDQVSYTIGAQFGKSLKSQNLDLDAKQVGNGIADGLKDDKLLLSEDEMQAAMMKLTEQRQGEMKVEAEKNKVASDAFLAKNKEAEGVKVTASGLQYKILEEGNGPSPKGDESVVVNYKGTLIDGKEFDSSYKRNMPAEFPIKNVIPGWTEGLQLMKKGGKAMLFVPPELGYGDRPRQNIPSNAVLIFEVELVDIKPPAAPGAAKAAAVKAPVEKKAGKKK
jgi:FKBP-type peptidyl-prolyl cis-trans isomerase